MSFMRPEIVESGYFVVELENGESTIIPFFVCPESSDLQDFEDYTDSRPVFAEVFESGYVWRLSAPGYMDCTDWICADSLKEAILDMLGMYGDGFDIHDFSDIVDMLDCQSFIDDYLLGLAFTCMNEDCETSTFGAPGCDIADCVDVESDIWDRLTDDQKCRVYNDCIDFYLSASDLLEDWPSPGSDFHLTRNGHGAGFWDRDLENGDKLTELAKPFGSLELVSIGTHIDELSKDCEGPDRCLETSFFEYGLLWKELDSEYRFYYGCQIGEYTHYGWADVSKDIDIRQEYDWVEWDSFLSSIGMEFEDWNELPLPQQIYNLMNHYGFENIFGTEYYHQLVVSDETRRFEFSE